MEQEPPKNNVIELKKAPSVASESGSSTGAVIAFEQGKQSLINKSRNIEKSEDCFSQGVALEQAGKFIQAEQKYLEALSFNPDASGALVNLGAMYTRSSSVNDIKKAETYLLRAIKIDPAYALAQFNLGCVYDKQKKSVSSSLCYIKALEIDPTYSNPAFNLAICLQEELSFKLALDYWNLYLKLDQSDNTYTREAKKQIKVLEAILKLDANDNSTK